MDISDFPTCHPYGLGLWQNHIERVLAGWVVELPVKFYRGREVTGFTQDNSGVDIDVSDGQRLRAKYLVGCDGGRSLVRKTSGIEFPGWDATTSALRAEVEMTGPWRPLFRFGATNSVRFVAARAENLAWQRPNALVRLQAHYHHCGEAASEKFLSAATFVR